MPPKLTPAEQKVVEELSDEIHSVFAAAYAIGESVNPVWLKNVIGERFLSHRAEVESVVENIIKMADELELECGKDGDKGTRQWMNFKGFRNAIRDKYLPTKQ